jgi:hypothetical protein
MSVLSLPRRRVPLETARRLARRLDRTASAPDRAPRRRLAEVASRGGTWALVVPVVLVNTFAGIGQTLWAMDHISPALGGYPVVTAVGFAATLESIAVYLAYQAHRALMAGDAALRLRVASYAAAGTVGALNYSHWSADWSPTAVAITYTGFSVISPWLWSIQSRSMHRAELRAEDLIDPRTVRFSMARWTLYPVRTFTAFRAAVWAGVVDPAVAIRLADRVDPVRSIDPDPGVSIEASIESIQSAADRPVGPPVIEAPKSIGSTPTPAGRSTRRRPTRQPRTVDELAVELAAEIESGGLDPAPSAEAIRRRLKCAPATARELRDRLASGDGPTGPVPVLEVADDVPSATQEGTLTT